MSANKNELHVIFGTGPLGLSVMHELTRQGKRVRMVNRKGAATVDEGVEIVKGDVSDPASSRAVCKGADVVYLCVSPNYIYKEWAEKWPPIIAGTIAGAAATGAKIVFGDNLYMYGAVDRPMTEDMPNAAHTRKGKLRITLTETLMQAHQSGKVQVAIGRGSDFYGPAVQMLSFTTPNLFYAALAGKKVSVIGKLDVPHTYTFIDDFGKALVTLGEHQEAMGQIWHVPSPSAPTARQFATMVYEEAGQPAKIGTVPTAFIKVAGLFSPLIHEVGEMMYEFNKPFRVDSSKFERTFGVEATPQREAIRQTLEWFRQQPQPAK